MEVKRGRKKKTQEALPEAKKIPKSFFTEKTVAFGENVRAARKERGFTADTLAKFLGISTAYVGLIERGERCPSMETFLKICEFFGESYEEMLTVGKGLSLAEKKRLSSKHLTGADLVRRKQKMLASMISTFNVEELDFLVHVTKSFKRFTLTDEVAMDDDSVPEEGI